MKQSLISPPPGEPDDPMELVGVSLPADEESIKEMAYTFAEEFAQLGYGEQRLLKIFRSPSYAAAHQAWLALGEDEVQRIVKECVAVFGSVRFVVQVPDVTRPDDSPPARRLPEPTAGRQPFQEEV